MKTIAVAALKGGVGKSSVVAGLGLALADKGYKVGFIDLDVTGSNLYSALGLAHSPKFGLDTVNEKVVVPEVNGFWLLSIASYTGEEYAVLWESNQHKEFSQIRDIIETADLKALKKQIDDILASSKWRFVTELLSPDIVTWPEPLDFMIADLPPSISHEMFSFFDQVKDLFGVFIVSQPSAISNTGLQRTIDLLRVQQIPIIGLVANQDGFLNRLGEIEYQFLSPRVDLKKLAEKAKIPYLTSIPQTGNAQKLKPYFSELADKVVDSKPVVLKDVTMGKRLKRKIVKGIARRL